MLSWGDGLALAAALAVAAGCAPRNSASAQPNGHPEAGEAALRPPEFPDRPEWDSMRAIVEQNLAILERGYGPETAMRALNNVLGALHFSGVVTLPTAEVPATEAAFAADLELRESVIEALVRHVDAGERSDEMLAKILDAKVFLEAELDALRTLGRWTAAHPAKPGHVLDAKNVRAPFIPYAPHRRPHKDIRTGTVGEGECFVVVKEIQGIKAQLVAERIPVWVEPWYARRRIVGHRIVWRLEFTPAEFVKRLSTCNGADGPEHSSHITEILEPELLNFWRFFGKGH